MSKKSTLINDIILISLVSFASIYFLFTSLPNRKEGNLVVVEINGKVVEEISLKDDGEYRLNNGSNTLKIQDGKAWIIDANCQDKTCEKQGTVHYNGQTIVCLPNKLSVRVVQQGQGVDIVL